MKVYRAEERVPAGTYLSRSTWELVSVEDGAVLKGGDATYYRLPVLLVLALGPFAGLAFILFLPLAVPLVALNALAGAVASGIGQRFQHYRQAHVRPPR